VYGQKSTQDDVYKEMGKPIEAVLSGFNCTVFAYGQTGAGKTHTMEGTSGEPGMIPRLARDLLDRLTSDTTAKEWSVQFSYLEVKCHDLVLLL
jgi:hypothetical protein